MYVKLRDRGTIFNDHTQDVAVTGNLPVKVKKTDKVKDGIRTGILIEVESKDAEKAIAEA